MIVARVVSAAILHLDPAFSSATTKALIADTYSATGMDHRAHKVSLVLEENPRRATSVLPVRDCDRRIIYNTRLHCTGKK